MARVGVVLGVAVPDVEVGGQVGVVALDRRALVRAGEGSEDRLVGRGGLNLSGDRVEDERPEGVVVEVEARADAGRAARRGPASPARRRERGRGRSRRWAPGTSPRRRSPSAWGSSGWGRRRRTARARRRRRCRGGSCATGGCPATRRCGRSRRRPGRTSARPRTLPRPDPRRAGSSWRSRARARGAPARRSRAASRPRGARARGRPAPPRARRLHGHVSALPPEVVERLRRDGRLVLLRRAGAGGRCRREHQGRPRPRWRDA